MLLLLYLQLALSLKPLLLLPGIYGSNLIVTASHHSSLWYCPVEIDHEILWVNHKYLVPPFYNCLFELLQCDYDETTNEITPIPGVHVDVQDFGGDKGLSYVDHGIGDIHVVRSLDHLIGTLESLGYKIHKDLFGLPYDWRLALSGFESNNFYEKLKLKIEKAYRINNNQKVTLLGYSCGGLVVHHFLTSVMDNEWKNKYVEKIIFLAPAFSGSATAIEALWKHTIPILSFLKSDEIQMAIQKIPVIYSMIPNFEVFNEIPLVVAPNNKMIYPKDFPQFLLDNNKIQKIGHQIMNKSLPYIKSAPREIGLPVYLMYNDGHDTLAAYNMTDGITDDPAQIKMPGDTTLTAFGQEYPCRGWNNEHPLVCHNFNMKEYHFYHMTMSYNPYVEHLIFNLTNNDEWTKIKGKRKIVGPFVEIFDENNSYCERPDIREKVEMQLP